MKVNQELLRIDGKKTYLIIFFMLLKQLTAENNPFEEPNEHLINEKWFVYNSFHHNYLSLRNNIMLEINQVRSDLIALSEIFRKLCECSFTCDTDCLETKKSKMFAAKTLDSENNSLTPSLERDKPGTSKEFSSKSFSAADESQNNEFTDQSSQAYLNTQDEVTMRIKMIIADKNKFFSHPNNYLYFKCMDMDRGEKYSTDSYDHFFKKTTTLESECTFSYELSSLFRKTCGNSTVGKNTYDKEKIIADHIDLNKKLFNHEKNIVMAIGDKIIYFIDTYHNYFVKHNFKKFRQELTNIINEYFWYMRGNLWVIFYDESTEKKLYKKDQDATKKFFGDVFELLNKKINKIYSFDFYMSTIFQIMDACVKKEASTEDFLFSATNAINMNKRTRNIYLNIIFDHFDEFNYFYILLEQEIFESSSFYRKYFAQDTYLVINEKMSQYISRKNKNDVYSYAQYEDMLLKKIDEYNFVKIIKFLKNLSSQINISGNSEDIKTHKKSQKQKQGDTFKTKVFVAPGITNDDEIKVCYGRKDMRNEILQNIENLKNLKDNLNYYFKSNKPQNAKTKLPIITCCYDEQFNSVLVSKFIKFYENLLDNLIQAYELQLCTITFISEDISKFCMNNSRKKNGKNVRSIQDTKKVMFVPRNFHERYRFVFDGYVRTMYLLSSRYEQHVYLLLNEISGLINIFILTNDLYKYNVTKNLKYSLYCTITSVNDGITIISNNFLDSVAKNIWKNDSIDFNDISFVRLNECVDNFGRNDGSQSIDSYSDTLNSSNSDDEHFNTSEKCTDISYNCPLLTKKNTHKTGIFSKIKKYTDRICHRVERFFPNNRTELSLCSKMLQRLKDSIIIYQQNLNILMNDIYLLSTLCLNFNIEIAVSFLFEKIKEQFVKNVNIINIIIKFKSKEIHDEEKKYKLIEYLQYYKYINLELLNKTNKIINKFDRISNNTYYKKEDFSKPHNSCYNWDQSTNYLRSGEESDIRKNRGKSLQSVNTVVNQRCTNTSLFDKCDEIEKEVKESNDSVITSNGSALINKIQENLFCKIPECKNCKHENILETNTDISNPSTNTTSLCDNFSADTSNFEYTAILSESSGNTFIVQKPINNPGSSVEMCNDKNMEILDMIFEDNIKFFISKCEFIDESFSSMKKIFPGITDNVILEIKLMQTTDKDNIEKKLISQKNNSNS
ncbi:hypothetical protein EDEG_01315 [Edhazardia aedis USNM 41457]|uniref:Uncharacterized protein n=1 Tax=Edhazardia aedis (strain USNM 41457) TaxID=1003232 RepID=J9DPH1_EDHAE|nr:hypothetical protein EDEG_01315 [Edhazardia aedis USNM 41457]|eukprot:EJW04445.1 hypothetical protein EDEG_01315 [Edhazardia aedis USNM 41457]